MTPPEAGASAPKLPDAASKVAAPVAKVRKLKLPKLSLRAPKKKDPPKPPEPGAKAKLPRGSKAPKPAALKSKLKAPPPPKALPKPPKVPKGGFRTSIPPVPKLGKLGVAALVAGVLGVVAGLVLFGHHLINSVPARTTSVFHLQPGMCLNPPTPAQAELATVSVVHCSTPHTEEAYYLANYSPVNDNYPGPDPLETFAKGTCLQEFAGYVGTPYQRSSLFYTYLLPSVRSWAVGDRTVVCVVTSTGAKLTSSVKGSKT